MTRGSRPLRLLDLVDGEEKGAGAGAAVLNVD